MPVEGGMRVVGCGLTLGLWCERRSLTWIPRSWGSHTCSLSDRGRSRSRTACLRFLGLNGLRRSRRGTDSRRDPVGHIGRGPVRHHELRRITCAAPGRPRSLQLRIVTSARTGRGWEPRKASRLHAVTAVDTWLHHRQGEGFQDLRSGLVSTPDCFLAGRGCRQFASLPRLQRCDH